MQQQVYAQKHQQLQQMRMGQPAGQLPRQAGPQMLQQQASFQTVLIFNSLKALRQASDIDTEYI